MKQMLFLFACFFTGASNAAVLTFDNAGTLSNQTYASYQGIADTYTQSGYSLTVGAGDHFDSMNSRGLNWHDGPLNRHSNNFAYLTYTGGLFDLNSFDFTRVSGDLITNLTTLTTYGRGINTVNLTGLTWAAFSPRGNRSRSLYLDDINVTASSVPEPSVLALLALGIAGISFSRKMKRN